MVFAIDAGNTNIVLGAFDGSGELLFTARIATDPLRTSDQYAVTIGNILNLYGVSRSAVNGAVISTVVPALITSLGAAIKLLFGIEPMTVGKGIKSGLKINGLDESAIGADLVCGAVGAIKKYGSPLIIFDFGTATTIPPIRLGMKKTVLNRLLPLMPWVSAYATANARMLMITRLTTANRAVYQKAWRKPGSAKALV